MLPALGIEPPTFRLLRDYSDLFSLFSLSDHQGDVPAGRPPGHLQPGGGSGARDQHAGAVLHQTQPGRQLRLHPGGREPGLRDHAPLHAASEGPERGRRAARLLHHRLRQRDR